MSTNRERHGESAPINRCSVSQHQKYMDIKYRLTSDGSPLLALLWRRPKLLSARKDDEKHADLAID